MTLSEALRDDLLALKSGSLILLPSSDASGRRIVILDPSLNTRKGYTSHSMVRAGGMLVSSYCSYESVICL